MYAALYSGIEFPLGEISFADEVVDYSFGTYVNPQYMTPSKALGIPENPGYAGADINAMGAVSTAPIPIPAAVWLLGSGLIGILGLRKR